MDYGHPLQLGALLPADPSAAVQLAVDAEAAGLDLVMVTETVTSGTPGADDDRLASEPWTLLAWVAGRTERVRLLAELEVSAGGPPEQSPAADVHRTLADERPPAADSHPSAATDRPPAVVARAAASLDLLSRGRVALTFSPAGSGRRVGTEPVVALEESLEVVRGIWDAAAPAGFTYRGQHHVLTGAQRGPAPAHSIPVWVRGTGYLLDVVARGADGWVAPDIGAARAGNPVLDAAVAAVGRDPREVRRAVVIDSTETARLLERPVDDAVAELLALVVDDGVATIVVAGEPGTVSRFATDLAPRVREAVAAERTRRGTVVGTVRSSATRAARRPGIAYDDVPASLADDAVEPGDAPYASVRSTYLRGGRPGLVLRPADPAAVADALAFARQQEVPLSVRSAGHGISGRSTNDGGIVIDVSRLSSVEVVDEKRRLVRVEPGARWGEVAAALAPYGWAISSGDFGGVGVGGLATTGGIGFLGRAHGLTIDRVRAVEMVLADGSHIRADNEENADLFWAARGAGFNFGIATAFEIEAAEVGDVGFAQLVFDAADTAEFIQRWGAVAEAAPRDLTSFLTIGGPRGGRLLAQTTTVVASADPETIVERLQALARVAPLVGQAVQVVPYHAVVATPDSRHDSEGEPVTRSGLLEHVTESFATDAERLIRSGQTFFFQIRAMGGATSDVPADATAFAHRSANFSVTAFGASRRGLDGVWDGMHHHFDGLYPSFETDPRPERLLDAYPPATLQRLREVKRRYDPGNVFRDNTNIEP